MTDRTASKQLGIEIPDSAGRAGDDGSGARFREAYHAEFKYVWHSLRRLGIRPADLEDLTHDVFVTAYRRFADYEPSRPLRAWLFGIAFRVAIDFRRRAANRARLTALAPPPETDVAVPDAELAKAQDRDLVLSGLDAIDEDRRAVFVMHELGGHPIPEVAETLEIPLNTAYSRLRLAREEFTERVRALQAKRK